MHFSKAAVLLTLAATGLPLRTAYAQSVAPTPGSAQAATEASAGASRQTVGWVIAGVGGASLLGCGTLVLLRDRKLDEMRDGYGADITDELWPYQAAATALFAAGVVGLGVGLPLALIGDHDTRVDVSLGRVVVRGTF